MEFPIDDKRGELLEKFLIDNNLSCCNVGNNPTFVSGSGFSTIIDLTLANYRLSQCVSNWHVEQVLHSTDHFRIRFTVTNCPNFRIEPVETWNYRKGAWSYFKSQLELGLLHWTCPRSWTDATIEQKLKQINDEVMKALDLSCPKKRCKSKYKFPTWWNPNLSKLRAKLHFMAKKSLLRAEMRTGLSVESIKLQLPLQKMTDGRNSHPKSTILLMFLNSSDPLIIAIAMLSVC